MKSRSIAGVGTAAAAGGADAVLTVATLAGTDAGGAAFTGGAGAGVGEATLGESACAGSRRGGCGGAFVLGALATAEAVRAATGVSLVTVAGFVALPVEATFVEDLNDEAGC